MKRLALFLLLLCGLSAHAQIFTTGQIVASNAVTYIPATNGTQISTYSVSIPQHVFQIQNQNFNSTNALTIYSFINFGGTTNLVPIGTYIPTGTNLIELFTTSATNFNLNIQFAVATTNDASTNLQVTIIQKQ